jgi:hypothetical protein
LPLFDPDANVVSVSKTHQVAWNTKLATKMTDKAYFKRFPGPFGLITRPEDDHRCKIKAFFAQKAGL